MTDFHEINILTKDIDSTEAIYSLVWYPNEDGQISLKSAYQFVTGAPQSTRWGKVVWQKSLLPSDSLNFWRLTHSRLQTDDQLTHIYWGFI